MEPIKGMNILITVINATSYQESTSLFVLAIILQKFMGSFVTIYEAIWELDDA